MTGNATLLQAGDPLPVGLENPAAKSPILFISDHAGRAFPRALGTLGLDAPELSRHIAWDIGIYGVTTHLAKMLDATYLFQPYSRLVIDCNRRPRDAQSIATVSDGTVVPGNSNLSEIERRIREREILEPYHREIERVLADRAARRHSTVIFAMHSCTDRLKRDAEPRPWHVGVIADTDWRIGDRLIELLEAETEYRIGRNQPYSVNMEADYTVPIHCEARGIPYVEIELRQDLIGDAKSQLEWATLLAGILPRAVEKSDVLAA
ncbi:N-formylglutamate amidohydrolase [Dongia sedimenti]|uniref:N-formylglutamate amidohydrolase n=1 Tax=Dongia sedimenti TaxID=3064282 RepID=A0ABU0YU11_9PROT|nr:N-formylglutamate amidohydrolase [Rhodospirillaceae bacterium R-7]